MDPAALIVTALVAGITAGLTETAAAGVKDAFALLKERLHKRLAEHPEAVQALQGLEKKPESAPRQAVLQEELAELIISPDDELLTLARALLEKLAPGKAAVYQVTISHSKNIAIGDQAQIRYHPPAKPDAE